MMSDSTSCIAIDEVRDALPTSLVVNVGYRNQGEGLVDRAKRVVDRQRDRVHERRLQAACDCDRIAPIGDEIVGHCTEECEIDSTRRLGRREAS